MRRIGPGLLALAFCVLAVPAAAQPDHLTGTAFSDFLGRLNNCTSFDGTVVTTGGFGGHCDWRLPTIQELSTLLLVPCGTTPCIDSTFGPTASVYWSATWRDFPATDQAWAVDFFFDEVIDLPKSNALFVRAVRGGS